MTKGRQMLTWPQRCRMMSGPSTIERATESGPMPAAIKSADSSHRLEPSKTIAALAQRIVVLMMSDGR
jgi:hypothetical protein